MELGLMFHLQRFLNVKTPACGAGVSLARDDQSQ